MAEYSKDALYFLKLPKGFFDNHQFKILEGMPNGKDYELMYLKLMCESISHNGYLRFSKSIPYTPEMIASITNTNVDVVRSGLKVLEELELIETTQDQSLFIPRVQEMTGITTKGAEMKRLGRQKGDKRETNVPQVSTECPPSVHQIIDIDNREEIIDKRNKTLDKDTRSSITSIYLDENGRMRTQEEIERIKSNMELDIPDYE